MAKKYLDGNQDEALKAIAAGIESGELGTAELKGLLDVETHEKKRQKVLHLLSTELEKAAAEQPVEEGDPEPEARPKSKGGDKGQRGEEIDRPAWQKPDYSGPLSGEQAAWRHKRLLDHRGRPRDDIQGQK